jgi:hypothetical protein
VLPASDRLVVEAKTGMVEEVGREVQRLLNSGRTDYHHFPTIASLFVQRLSPLTKIFDFIILDCPADVGCLPAGGSRLRRRRCRADAA